MTLRKVAALLAAFGLTVGLIGGGVGAVFQDQSPPPRPSTSATFGCQITDCDPGGVDSDRHR